MQKITMKELLEAGVHFGHQTRRWNPKMKRYIFGERNGIYIIDLQKTVKMFNDAYRFVRDSIRQGKKIMFVGTKRQAQDVIQTEAERLGIPFVSERWLGGALTNFQTIKQSIQKLKKLEFKLNDEDSLYTKKEKIILNRQYSKLKKNLDGIKDMRDIPDIVYVVDVRKERNAIAEARKLGLKIIAICDTNTNPDKIDFPIPGNDDAIRSIRLITTKLSQAVEEGLSMHVKDVEDKKATEKKPVVEKTQDVIVEANEESPKPKSKPKARPVSKPKPSPKSKPVSRPKPKPKPKPKPSAKKSDSTGNTGKSTDKK